MGYINYDLVNERHQETRTLSSAQVGLSTAVGDSLAAAQKVAEASRDLQRELSELRDMHSQLARLNIERQKTIEALADALGVAQKYIQGQMDGPGRGSALKATSTALKLAGREPEI